eukprot:301441-Hanusia_phi.AAC.2
MVTEICVIARRQGQVHNDSLLAENSLADMQVLHVRLMQSVMEWPTMKGLIFNEANLSAPMRSSTRGGGKAEGLTRRTQVRRPLASQQPGQTRAARQVG